MPRFKAFMIPLFFMTIGFFMIYDGTANYQRGFVKITPKYNAPYVASPDAHKVDFFLRTFGISALGLIVFSAGLYMCFIVLFPKSERHKEAIKILEETKLQTRGPELPNWLSFIVIAAVIVFFIYLACQG